MLLLTAQSVSFYVGVHENINLRHAVLKPSVLLGTKVRKTEQQVVIHRKQLHGPFKSELPIVTLTIITRCPVLVRSSERDVKAQ